MYQKPELTLMDALGQILQPGDQVIYISGVTNADFRVGVFLGTKEVTSKRYGGVTVEYKFHIKSASIDSRDRVSSPWIRYRIGPNQEGYTDQLLKLTSHSLQLLQDIITKKIP